MRVSGAVRAEQRRIALIELLGTDGTLTLESAAQRFGVHEMTVRRDLDALEREGLARRVRGGAVVVDEDPYAIRVNRASGAKRTIARKLSSLVPRDCAIAVDASSTLLYLARELRSHELSVLTNGIPSFDAARGRPGIRPILTGGEPEQTNASLIGPLAVAAVRSFHFERVFLSTTSISTSGTSEPTMSQVEVKRAMVSVSAHVVVAVDSYKLDTRSAVRGLDLADIDLLVTELDPQNERLDPYRELVELL